MYYDTFHTINFEILSGYTYCNYSFSIPLELWWLNVEIQSFEKIFGVIFDK